MKYIDIHCHLDFPDYGEELPQVLERMKEKEVGAITIGTDLESSKRAVQIAEANDGVWACIGVHPREETTSLPAPLLAKEGGEEKFESELSKLAQSPKVVAIGECGLDFFRIDPKDLEEEKKRQAGLFEMQIEFAIKHDKPLMLHCRDAYEEVLEVLKKYPKARGNCHFFAGSTEQAKNFLDIGFTMSFTGVVTFTHAYDEVIKFLPKESIMSETDAPFVAPVPYRGNKNEPSFVVEVAGKIAEIRDEDREVFKKQLLDNANRVFGLSLQS